MPSLLFINNCISHRKEKGIRPRPMRVYVDLHKYKTFVHHNCIEILIVWNTNILVVDCVVLRRGNIPISCTLILALVAL